jgi:hypothetical protein
MTLHAVAIFCEDVREEKSGQFTLVGILPDNVNIVPRPHEISEAAHPIIPRLGVYVRIHIDVHDNPGPISIKLAFPNGEEAVVGQIGSDLVETAKRQAQAANMPIAGIISSAVMQGFVMIQPGLVLAIVETANERYPCGVLNLGAVPNPSPSA